jgi:hypothetical protein
MGDHLKGEDLGIILVVTLLFLYALVRRIKKAYDYYTYIRQDIQKAKVFIYMASYTPMICLIPPFLYFGERIPIEPTMLYVYVIVGVCNYILLSIARRYLKAAQESVKLSERLNEKIGLLARFKQGKENLENGREDYLGAAAAAPEEEEECQDINNE